MGEHCCKQVLSYPLGYNHDPNGVVTDELIDAPTRLKGGNAYILWGF